MISRLTALLMILIVPLTSMAESAKQSFKKGIAAFKQTRFNDALNYFEKAQASGISGPYIQYNLGSTYYKLGKYEQAQKAFLMVANHEDFRQVAYYNLGLTARRLKNYKQAVEWFNKAQSEQDGQIEITNLAAKMLLKVNEEMAVSSVKNISAVSAKSNSVVSATSKENRSSQGQNTLLPANSASIYAGIQDKIGAKANSQRVNSYNDPASNYVESGEISRGSADEVEVVRLPETSTGKKGKITGGFQIAIGIDDNIEAVATEGTTGIEDQYLEMLGFVSIPLSADWKILGSAYSGMFTDSDDDYRSLSAGIEYSHKLNGWTIKPNVTVSNSYLASQDYQTTADFMVTGQKKLGAGKWLTLRYRYSDISSNNSIYDYEEGSRSQLRADYYTRVPVGKLRLRYEYETNDRDDVGSSTNASPTRHTFRGRLARKVTDKWNASGELEWRTSEYDIDSIGRVREDDRFRVRFDVNRSMNKKWSVGLLYVYTDNDSNINENTSDTDDFSYARNDVQIYSFWRF